MTTGELPYARLVSIAETCGVKQFVKIFSVMFMSSEG